MPNELYNTHPLKFKSQQCIYTNGSFIPPDKNGTCNTIGVGVYCPANNLQIAERLLGLQNILHAELNTLLIAIQCTQHLTQDTQIFIDNLNSIYLVHNHIQHPSSQHKHPDKLLIAAIVNHITCTTHKITIQKVRAHTGITCNDIAYQLANSEALLDKPNNTPRIHTVHTTPPGLMESPHVPTRGPYVTYKHISTRNTETKNLD